MAHRTHGQKTTCTAFMRNLIYIKPCHFTWVRVNVYLLHLDGRARVGGFPLQCSMLCIVACVMNKSHCMHSISNAIM